MCRRMCLSVWLISSVTLLLVDLRSVALLQKDVESPRRCFSCGTSNSTSSVECRRDPLVVQCPDDQPYCGTTASLPTTSGNSTSSLGCVSSTPTDKLCSIRYCQQKGAYKIICVCKNDLCNNFFSKKFLQHLLNFTSENPIPKSTTDFTDAFYNTSQINETTIYERKSTQISKRTELTTIRTTTMKLHEHLPKAESLKHDVTVPSDDDEDEGEGSGSFEETRSQKRPASVPAGPSSFLPANENKASPLFLNFLVTSPLLLYVIV